MKKIKLDEKKAALLLLGIACVGYFLLLFRFYHVTYYAPDLRLYVTMAQENKKAADGFSSLFIWFASLCSIMPEFMTYLSLGLLCFSIFHILIFYYVVLWENIQKFILVTVICLSCGVWYYFYGKLFYDIPFSVYNYSLCLLAFMKLYENREDRKKAQLWWYLLVYLLGLMLSWKPYNVFMACGVGLLALAYDEFRKEALMALNSVKKVSISVALLLAGYITGNFNLLRFPKETIEGIQAYPATYEFSKFLSNKHRILWDHVNDLPFSITVFSVLFLVVVGIVWPIVIKKFRYLAISLFMFGALALFISNFSRGYAWHGFCYGFFVITYCLILVKETKPEVLGGCIFRLLLAVTILVQCVVNFGYYIPTQASWEKRTEEAIAVLEENETEIFEHVTQLVEGFGGAAYTIDNAVKRYRPYAPMVLWFRPVSVGQPYLVAENIELVDPLFYRDYDGWTDLCTRENYVQREEESEYVIFIIPNVFKSMNDVADIRKYDDKHVKTVIREADYTIYVYDNL